MRQSLRLAAVATALLALQPSAVAQSAAASPYATAVSRTVRGIFEYARWPQRRDPMTLCVTAGAQHAGQIANWRMADGRTVARRNIAAQAGAVAGCDALYIGTVAIGVQRQLTAAVRGRGVLTIAESDPTNASEAMFVWTYKAGALSFRLNVDAVSRSGMKVDPRVLRLAKGGG